MAAATDTLRFHGYGSVGELDFERQKLKQKEREKHHDQQNYRKFHDQQNPNNQQQNYQQNQQKKKNQKKKNQQHQQNQNQTLQSIHPLNAHAHDHGSLSANIRRSPQPSMVELQNFIFSGEN